MAHPHPPRPFESIGGRWRLRAGAVLTTAVLATACDPPLCTQGGVTNCMLPAAKPQAVLAIAATSPIVGAGVSGRVTASGCKKIRQVGILVNDTFILDTNYKGDNTEWNAPTALFERFFPQKGIEATLNFTARVVCDEDGREGVSQPVGRAFFPAAAVVDLEGAQALPDAFIAEGGTTSQPTTFLGCVGGVTAGLMRLAQNSTELKTVVNLPFPCSVGSDFTPPSTAQAGAPIRWLIEPGVGAFAFQDTPGQATTDLVITSQYQGRVKFLTMAPSGDAVLVEDTALMPYLKVLLGKPGGANPVRYSLQLSGIPLAAPVFDTTRKQIWVAVMNASGGVATHLVHRIDYDRPSSMGDPIAVTRTQPVLTTRYDEFSNPNHLTAAFRKTGGTIYMNVVTVDNTNNQASTFVLACPTVDAVDCSAGGRTWTSPGMPGVFDTIYVHESMVVVAGADGVFFLDVTTGQPRSVNAITPTGSNVVKQLVPGVQDDFYVLAGPSGLPFPTEAIAVDQAGNPELWRVNYGVGDSPQSALTMAVDAARQPWLRLGLTNVKPHPATTYCALLARGNCR